MKKVAFVLIVIVLLVIINGLVQSIFELTSKQDLLESAQNQLEAEKLKNAKLKGELSYVQSSDFIEQQAHNKLFLVKEGEQPVLISQKLLSGADSKKTIKVTPNWQKWLNLFF